MTLDEIAYNLLNLVRGGRSSNDEHISLDQIIRILVKLFYSKYFGGI